MAAPHIAPVAKADAHLFRPVPHALLSKAGYLRWLVTLPLHSSIGAGRFARWADGPVPPAWAQELGGKRVLVMGTGPSLDRAPDSLFGQFDATVYINFALTRMTGAGAEYFFTTDLGPVQQFITAHGSEAFRRLGRDHVVIAPIFLDQYRNLTPQGADLFTWLAYDAAGWRAQPVRLGPVRLPLALRRHPRQPDWDRFVLRRGGRRLPVIDHSSALTAILFAAINGAREIGLIGCDFSAGRSAAVAAVQYAPDASVFAGAVGEFHRIREALTREGVTVTNHSWAV